LLSERSRFAFAKVAVLGFTVGLVAVGVVALLSATVPEVATFMNLVSTVFAHTTHGFGLGFPVNMFNNAAHLATSAVVASTAVGGIVGFSYQMAHKRGPSLDIHSKEFNAIAKATLKVANTI
jgi:hypothetical protein